MRDDNETKRRSVPGNGKISYLSQKDTSQITAKLKSGSSITIPRSKVKQMEKTIGQLQSNKQKSEAEIAEKQVQILTLEDEINSAKEIAIELNRKIEQKESEIKSLQAGNLYLHQNIEFLRVELKQLKNDLVEATKCINDNETQICLLRGEASKLLDDNNLLCKQLIKSHDEVSKLQIHLADANEIKIGFSSRIENIEMLNQKLELKNELLNRQLTVLSNVLYIGISESFLFF